MISKKIIIVISILAVVLIAGCSQTQYVCPDGKTVNNPNLCGKECAQAGDSCADLQCCNGLACLSGICVSGSVLTCGNNICQTGEDCSTCQQDCGACPVVNIEFKGKSITSKDFWKECDWWCSSSSGSNVFAIFVKKIQNFDLIDPRADFSIYVKNNGTEPLRNITASITCVDDKTNSTVLTSEGSYKNAIIQTAFDCTSCNRNCICDANNDKVQNLESLDIVKFTITSKVKNVVENFNLICDIKFTAYPQQSAVKKIEIDYVMI